MNKEKIMLEKIDIPKIEEDDLLETIQKAKLIYNENQIPKFEIKRYAIINILLQYCWPMLILQSIVCAFVMTSSLISSILPAETNAFAFINISAVIFSVICFLDIIFALFFKTKELELTCPLSFQHLMFYKTLILSLTTMIFIMILSLWITSFTNISFRNLIFGGCIPFFTLNTIFLFVIKTKQPIYYFMLYLITLSALLVIDYKLESLILNVLNQYGLGIFSLTLSLYLLSLFKTKKGAIS